MKLDLSAFEQAVASLAEVLARYASEPEDSVVQDSVIQRFEYTHELAFRLLKRYLATTVADAAEVDLLSFRDVIRMANEKGLLLHDVNAWQEYRERRNMTSHTYDKAKAREVALIATPFYEEAKFLLERIEERNGDSD